MMKRERWGALVLLVLLLAVPFASAAPTLTKQTNPATAPTGTVQNAGWLANGTLLCVAHTTTPFVTIYSVSGTTLTKLSDPATLPTGNARDCSFSPDGLFLAVAHTTSPFMTVYSITYAGATPTFTKVTNPATLPGGTTSYGVAWSPNSTYLTVSSGSSPFIQTYTHSGSTFTKIPDPATLPGSLTQSVSYDPTGAWLTTAESSTPFIRNYAVSGSTFTAQSNPAVLPAGSGQSISWAPSGAFVSVGHSTTPFFTTYSVSGSTFSKIGNPSTLPSGSCNGVGWSPDSNLLACATGNSPTYFGVWERSGSVLTKIADPATLPTSAAVSVDFKVTDGSQLIVGWAGSPYLYTYDVNPPAAPVPSAPLTVAASPVSSSSLSVSWAANPSGTTPTGYSLFLKKGASAATASPMNTSAYVYYGHVDGTSATLSGLLTGTTYSVRVVGTAAAGEGAASDNAQAVTYLANLTVTPSVGVNALSWTPSQYSSNNGTRIYRNTSSSISQTAPFRVATLAVGVSAWNDTNLTAGQTYFYCVAPLDLNLTEGFCSASSTSVSIVLEAEDMHAGVKLSWVKSGEGTVSGYNVYRTNATATTLIGTTPSHRSIYYDKAFNASDLCILYGYRVDGVTLNGTVSSNNVTGFPYEYPDVESFGDNGTIYGARPTACTRPPSGVIGTPGINGTIVGGVDTLATAISIPSAAVSGIFAVIFILVFAAAGYSLVTAAPGAGAVGGAFAGVLFSIGASFIPIWLVVLLAALGVAGFLYARSRGGGE